MVSATVPYRMRTSCLGNGGPRSSSCSCFPFSVVGVRAKHFSRRATVEAKQSHFK